METAGGLIEDVRDYVKRKRQGDMALCYLLDRFWPVPGDKSADMSGMICFVALFRVILCRLDPRDMMDDMIGQNGFLRFAVSSFGAAEGSAKEREACKLMHDLLTEQLGGQPTFEHLAESDMLLKSIWSHDAFRLFYPILWRSGPASLEWDCLPDESRDIVEAKKSLIVWETSKHGSILDAAVDSEGVFRGRLEGVKEDQVEFALAFRAPLVMRVKVLFDDKIEGFQMSDISSIRLPVTRTALKQLGVGKRTATAPRVRTFTKGPGAYTYRLLAMVRLRATGSEQDDVRFYDPWGSLILPQAGRPGLETFCSLDWSMQDQNHSLMLYYVRLEPKSSGFHTKITDEYGGEKSGAMSADTPGSGRETPAPVPILGSSGTPIVAAAEGSGATGAGASTGPARSPGATSKQSQQPPSVLPKQQPDGLTKSTVQMGHTGSPELTAAPEQKKDDITKVIARVGDTSSPDLPE